MQLSLREVSVFGVFLVRILLHSDWIQRDTEYSVRMQKNADQKNSEYGQLSRSVLYWKHGESNWVFQG